MGIKRFAYWLENFFSASKVSKLPNNANSLLLDANALVHNIAQKIFAYGDRYGNDRAAKEAMAKLSSREQIDILCQGVCEEIARLLALIKPENYLVIAFDGVAPFAKITQQRKRRYKGAIDKVHDTTWKWNSDAISPGTDFMISLDEKITEWLTVNSKTLPRNIIYSSHLDPGEGEHKIMEYIRSGLIEPGEYAGPNVLVGLDADLTILSLLSPLEHIYLFKENWSREHKREFRTIINIETIKVSLNNIFGYKRSPKMATLLEEIQQSCRDFAVIVQLIGNDFLPTIIALHSPDDSFEYMFSLYNKIRQPLTDQTGQIIWTNFTKLIELITLDEEKLLIDIYKKNLKYPYADLSASVTVVPSTETRERDFELDYSNFRGLWYSRMLSPATDEGSQLIAMLEEMEDFAGLVDPYNNDGVINIVEQYIYGMQWILRYYMVGHDGVTHQFIFRYHQAPLLSDLLVYLTEEDRTMPTLADVSLVPDESRLNPIQQLLAILPPSSRDLIPIDYQHLLIDVLVDIAPEKFKLELQGASADWEAYPLLPWIEASQIIEATKTVKHGRLNKKYHDKKPLIFQRQREFKIPYVALSAAAFAKSRETGYEPKFARLPRGPKKEFPKKEFPKKESPKKDVRRKKYIPINRKWSDRRDLFEGFRE